MSLSRSLTLVLLCLAALPAAALPDPALIRAVLAGAPARPDAAAWGGIRPESRPDSLADSLAAGRLPDPLSRPARTLLSQPAGPGFEARLARIAARLDCLADHRRGPMC